MVAAVSIGSISAVMSVVVIASVVPACVAGRVRIASGVAACMTTSMTASAASAVSVSGTARTKKEHGRGQRRRAKK
jgi:hypothetical protein